jgi:hypothetical protein
MAIHYNGSVQRTPGGLGCKADRDGVTAYAQDWRAATCGKCMVKGLLGLRLVHAEPGSIPGTVVNVSRYEVGLTFLDDEPAPTAVSMAELDSGDWSVVPAEPEAQSGVAP